MRRSSITTVDLLSTDSIPAHATPHDPLEDSEDIGILVIKTDRGIKSPPPPLIFTHLATDKYRHPN